MGVFKDYFSGHAKIYAQARPGYPDELFEYLAGICVYRNVAWDCATGNGQAAISLAKYFSKVIATDASPQQLEHALRDPKIEYKVATAEHSGLPDSYTDIITVAAAIHWFDIEKFFREADRVLKPMGILAVWTYNSTNITPEIDAILKKFAGKTLGSYWPDESLKYVFKKYENLPFPYSLLEAPEFEVKKQWTLRQLLNLLMSWSGTQNYIKIKGENPVDIVLPELEKAWGDPESLREVRWSLYLKAGRKEKYKY